MKNRFHVFSRMFSKLAGSNTAFANVFLFLLLALLMAPSAWADSVYITSNGAEVKIPCTGEREATVLRYSEVTSFKIITPSTTGRGPNVPIERHDVSVDIVI